MSVLASQMTSITIVYLTAYWGADQRKHQSSVSQAFVGGIHRRTVNSPHKGPVTRKIFPFDDVIMVTATQAYCNVWTGTIPMKEWSFGRILWECASKKKHGTERLLDIRGAQNWHSNNEEKTRNVIWFVLSCVSGVMCNIVIFATTAPLY